MLSVTMNLCLLVVAGLLGRALYQRSEGGGTPAAMAGEESSSGSAGLAPAAKAQPAVPRPLHLKFTETASAAEGFNWRRVESADYKTYVTNLRAIGCPEQTIRDIITADVKQAFAQRRKEAIAARLGEFRYWNTQSATPELLAAYAQQKEAVNAQMHDVLQELVGSGSVGESSPSWVAEETDYKLSFLPESLRQQVRAVDARYEEVEPQIKALSDWQPSTTDPAQLQAILERYASKRADLAQLLTPEQLEQYEMTVSWTADNLRQAMAKFNPSPDEFRTIFQEWRAHDEHLAELRAHNEPDPGDAQVFENIRQALGDERFAEYRRTWWK
jgi:hypothetical protein